MGSGVSGSVQKAETNSANAQAAAAQQFGQLAQQSMGKMNTLTQPAINYDTNLVNAANSGNYGALVGAAGPTLGIISQQQEAAKSNIMNTIPSGAGRDEELAQLPIQTAGQTSQALNQAYQGALGNMTQIGAAYGGVGLQEGSQQLSGLQGASQGYGQIAGQQAQGKASTMGFLGSLAGAAGTAAGGFLGR